MYWAVNWAAVILCIRALCVVSLMTTLAIHEALTPLGQCLVTLQTHY